jgi:hypothetical protein
VVLDKENQNEFGRDLFVIRVLPEVGVNQSDLETRIKYNVKASTEITPDQVLFENNSEKFEAELFARTGIKADYVIERRHLHASNAAASYTMDPLP